MNEQHIAHPVLLGNVQTLELGLAHGGAGQRFHYTSSNKDKYGTLQS